MTKIYQFKVKDYATILYGKKHDGIYYVERGDGTKYYYEGYRIEWAKEICEVEE